MLYKFKNIKREKVNLFLFLSGESISLFGSAIYTFALGLYLLKTTGSGLTFATNIVLYTLPLVFFNPLAGVIADRINKKIVVVGSDLFNGIFLLSVYLVAGKIGLSVPLIYISTFLMTVLTTFFNIGIESAKPELVSKEKLVDINSLARVIQSGSYVIGPMVGGLVYALLDMRLFILINAISFMISAVMEYFIDFQYNKKNRLKAVENQEDKNESIKKEVKENVWLEMKEGYRYIFSRQHMKALVYIFIALNFFFNYAIIVPLPYLLNSVWKINSYIYGIVEGGFPVGMIIGALLVKKLMARISYSKLLKRINYSVCIGSLAFGLPMIFFRDVPGNVFILIYYSFLTLFTGLIISWVDVPMNILLQRIVPGRILGRVLSVKLSIIKIVVPFALILSGYLVNVRTPLFLFVSGPAIFVLFNILFFKSVLGKKFVNISNEQIEEKCAS